MITKKILENAYLKLKKTVFYENSNLLHLKKQIAIFEEKHGFLTKKEKDSYFNNFKSTLEKELLPNEGFGETITLWLNEISSHRCIKKLENSKIEYNYMIDCPIELHILAIVWIQLFGYKMDSTLMNESYGYRCEDPQRDQIFKTYTKQYQNWTNCAFDIAEQMINKKKDAIIIKLDIKRFYYNIDKTLLHQKIEDSFPKFKKDPLLQLILAINDKYSEVVHPMLPKDSSITTNYHLPIGIYSSPILANFYLKEFDEAILEHYPDYYGRYVDDLILVLSEHSQLEREKLISNNNFDEYLNKRFRGLFTKELLQKLGIQHEIKIKDSTKNQFRIFTGKLREILFLKAKEELFQETSTFAFEPNEKAIKELFVQVNLSSEKDLKKNKFNVSVYLSKIYTLLQGIKKEELDEKLKKYLQHISFFFKDENIITYSVYLPKVMKIFLLIEDIPKIELLINEACFAFNKYEKNEDSRIDLYAFLISVLESSLALNPKIAFSQKQLFDFASSKRKDQYTSHWNTIVTLIHSNLFQETETPSPLLNYLDLKEKDLKKINFLREDYFYPRYTFLQKELEIMTEKVALSPRFIHFNEWNIFYLRNKILDYSRSTETAINLSLKRYQEKVESPLITEYIQDSIQYLDFPEEKTKNKFKIGVASFRIEENEIKQNLEFEFNLSLHKKQRLFDLLNTAKKNHVDILIFSEVSIPIQWLPILNDFARRNQMLITGGLEHIQNHKKEVGNYLFTIIPYYNQKYRTAGITVRLKNDYSPGELKMLEHLRLKKMNSAYKFNIFSWKSLYFSNFNCFELADICSRALLKNKIDFLIASVFNKDLKYFTNILESSCRDLHAYVAQSNTSLYGDCKVLQPAASYEMTKACFSGGLIDNLLVEEIDIKALRKFQALSYFGQDANRSFKLAPPNMDMNLLKARMENNLIQKLQEEEILILKNLCFAFDNKNNAITIKKIVSDLTTDPNIEAFWSLSNSCSSTFKLQVDTENEIFNFYIQKNNNQYIVLPNKCTVLQNTNEELSLMSFFNNMYLLEDISC